MGKLETTRIVVRKKMMICRPYLDRFGEDDLIQDCLLHWVKVRHKYKPERNASKKTFLSIVVSNKLNNILEKVNSKSEEINKAVVSLNKYETSRLDERIVNDKSYLLVGLASDLSDALSILTPTQRKLCGLLSQPGMNKKKAAKKLGIHRSLLYREMNRLKNIFEKEGFKEYLNFF